MHSDRMKAASSAHEDRIAGIVHVGTRRRAQLARAPACTDRVDHEFRDTMITVPVVINLPECLRATTALPSG